MFFILKKHSKRLDHSNIIVKYGIFYMGFKNKFFYWEIILINIRKIMTTAIAVSIPTGNVSIASLSCMLALFLSSALTKYNKPFYNDLLNNVEILSIFVGILSINLATFFIDGEVLNNDNLSVLFFVLMIVINIVFIIYWFYHFFKIYVLKLKRKLNFTKSTIKKFKFTSDGSTP
jgi:hypothetical protein